MLLQSGLTNTILVSSKSLCTLIMGSASLGSCREGGHMIEALIPENAFALLDISSGVHPGEGMRDHWREYLSLNK